MALAFSRPLDGAWRRMSGLLFRPFDLGRWFVLGFTAWLAGMVDSGGSAGSHLHYVLDADEDLYDWPGRTWDGVRDVVVDTWALGVVIFVVLGALMLGLVLLWIGSRGQFVFLDNLAHRRTQVTRPWSEFAAQGDSLFLWQVVYGVVALMVVGALTVGGVLGTGGLAALEFPPLLAVPFYLAGGILAFAVVVTLIYVEFFLYHAVAPIMYRRRCPATEAWRAFGGVFRDHPGSFVLFGLVHLVIGFAAGLFFFTAGLLTCCAGLLVMAIPYLGTVLTLPLPVFLRYFDLEFMGQLGPDWNALEPLPDPGAPGPDTGGPRTRSGQFEGDGTVIGAEDAREDPGGAEPRPEDA